MIQAADGTLTLGPVNAIEEKFGNATTVKVAAQSGDVTADNGCYTLAAESYVLLNRLSECNRIEMTVTTESATDRFGISFVRGTDSAKYYTLMMNPEGDAKRKINFEEEGTEGIGFINGGDGYVFDRPADNTYHIVILNDNSVVTMYVNNAVAHTTRIHGIQKNCWSINNYGGCITISDLKVSKK